LADEKRSSHLLAKQMKAELARLEKREENLIELAAEGGAAIGKVRQHLADIQREKDKIAERMTEVGDRLAFGVQLIGSALALLGNPQKLYMTLSPPQRKYMNDALFEAIYVYDAETVVAVLKPPFDELIQARDQIEENGSAASEREGNEIGRPGGSRLGPLATLYFDGGLSNGLMVVAE